MVFFSFLNIFITAALKSLLSLPSTLSQQQFLLTTFFLTMGYTFLFLCMSHHVFVKNWAF